MVRSEENALCVDSTCRERERERGRRGRLVPVGAVAFE